MINLIGISGKKESGKDTLAALIQDKSEYPWENRKFAYALKEIVGVLVGISPSDLDSPEIKTFLCPLFGGRYTYRELLQGIGTDLFREQFHPDVWVDALMRHFEGQYWIISDVRFPNEALAIKQRGGLLIRVERPKSTEDAHPSETALDDYPFDYTIKNDGDLIDFEQTATAWIRKVLH